MSGAPPGSHPPESRTWARLRAPVLLFCLAACLRLAPVLAVPDLPIGLDDMFQYDMLGRSLAAGNGFRWYAPPDQAQILAMLKAHTQVDVDAIALTDDPRGVETTFRAPLYPAFLAVIYRLSGLPGRLWAARLVQALVMALLAPMAFALALRLGASSRLARTAGVVVAVWPMLVVLPLALATENLFIPLVTLGMLVVLRAADTRRDRDFALGGFVFGLAILTRSVIAGFPILAGIWLWRQGLRRGAILLAGVAMALTIPWSTRATRCSTGSRPSSRPAWATTCISATSPGMTVRFNSDRRLIWPPSRTMPSAIKSAASVRGISSARIPDGSPT